MRCRRPPARHTYGDLAWWTVFPDPDLQELIRTALAQNYDVRVAVARILQAQSQVTIARSPIFPTVDGGVTGPYNAYTGSERPSPDRSFEPRLGLGFSWELDFWGRYRRGTEAAQAGLLAAEEARYGVMATLVSQVGQAYLRLRALDLTLEISSHRGFAGGVARAGEARLDGGVAGILDVRQAETLLYTATKTIPEAQRQIEQTGEFHQRPAWAESGARQARASPRAADRGPGAAAGPAVGPADAATGHPRGGAATGCGERADRRRQIAALSADHAFRICRRRQRDDRRIELRAVRDIQRAGGIAMPLFNAGRLQANVDYNEARAQEAALRYQQTLLQAFREVADALVDVRKRQEFRQQQDLLVNALADASQVAKLRYEGGVSSYLEVLDTERQLFDAELSWSWQGGTNWRAWSSCTRRWAEAGRPNPRRSLRR